METTPQYLFDVSDKSATGVYSGLDGSSAIYNAAWFSTDNKEIRVGLVIPTASATQSNGRRFDYIDPTGGTFEIAIGRLDRGPTSGTFRGEFNGTTYLTGIAYNISAADMETRINLNIGSTAVVVTKPDAHTWRFAWLANGAQDLLEFTPDFLAPACSATVSRVQEGNADNPEVQLLRILQRPFGYNAEWEAAPAADATVTPIQVGSSTAASVQRITLTGGEPYDGSFVVYAEIDGDTRSATIPYNASSGVFTQLMNGDEVAADRTVTVTKVAGSFSWDIKYNAVGEQEDITFDVSGLMVPLTLRGKLPLNTEQTFAAFSEVAEAEITALMEVKWTPSGGDRSTPFQGPVLLKEALIDFSTLLPTPSGDYVRSTRPGKYRFKTDGTFQLWNVDQSLFHTITVTGLAGAETLSIAAGEA